MKQDEILKKDYMYGYCHILALALKSLHPTWTLRARLGFMPDAEDESDYIVDHVWVVDPTTQRAYDVRGSFENEQELLDWDDGYDYEVVDFDERLIRENVKRLELKPYSRADIQAAMAALSN